MQTHFNAVLIKCCIATLLISQVSSCGGSKADGGGSTSTFSGLFQDAPTQGLKYSSTPSGLSGTTDANGTFKFQAGDVVSFIIPSSSGDIEIGKHIPLTPSSTSETPILHVSSLDNGNQIAGVLQSLGGTGDLIDVRNVTLSNLQKTQIQKYIESGIAADKPAVINISESTAQINAMKSLEKLPANQISFNLESLLSGSVVIHSGIVNISIVSGQGAGNTVKVPRTELTYFKSDGTTSNLCINVPWIDSNPFNDGRGNHCTSSGINPEGHWAITSGSKNTLTHTLLAEPDFLSTVVFKDLNNKQGLYTSTGAAYSNYAGFTGYGSYVFINKNWNKSFLANSVYYVRDNDQCTDGIAQFNYSSDATTFTKKCKISRIDGGNNDPVLAGTLENVTEIPGLAKLIPAGVGSPMYVGVTYGSTAKSGRSILIKVGDNLCGNTVPYSLEHCGSVKFVTYFN